MKTRLETLLVCVVVAFSTARTGHAQPVNPPETGAPDAGRLQAPPGAPVAPLTAEVVPVHGGANPLPLPATRCIPHGLLLHNDSHIECKLNDTLIVQLPRGKVKELRAGTEDELGLFVEGRFLERMPADSDPEDDDALRFHLVRNEKNQHVWDELIGGRIFQATEISIAVGREGHLDNAYKFNKKKVMFGALRMDARTLTLSVFMAVLLFMFWILVFRTTLVRDPKSVKENPRKWRDHGVFSLSRVQMAVWSFNTVFAFLIIWMVTGSTAEITKSILALIGIGAATGLGAALIDQKKATDAAAAGKTEDEAAGGDAPSTQTTLATATASPEGTTLAVTVQPLSTKMRSDTDNTPAGQKGSLGFFHDVLTDPQGGYTPYRLQMVVWTFVLSIVFWGVVYETLAMPEFDNTMLALMGISSGAYLGAKPPENKAAAAAPRA